MQGQTRAQVQGRGWTDIDGSISGSRSSAREMQDDDDDDDDAINSGRGTEIPARW